jgi:hypothetical protein
VSIDRPPAPDARPEILSAVSFEKTPLLEIGVKANEILAAGWEYRTTHPDRWTVTFSKRCDPGTEPHEAEAELAAIMADYWVSAEELSPPTT